MSTPIIIIMGVSGAGKTTIGTLLSDNLAWPFYDADDFHPEENKQKMAAGIPLTDRDRIPWLLAIRENIESHLAAQQPAIFSCSALKADYREVLQRDDNQIKFVYLKGTKGQIAAHLQARKGHFMPAELLDSQFATLEEPENAWVYDVGASPEMIVDGIQQQLGVRPRG